MLNTLQNKMTRYLGRQYRRRDGASARAAECLFRQCARHVVHQADVRHADPGHVRVSCRSMALAAEHPISGPRSSISATQLDDLTQQLASGRVSTTYAGQGANRGFALSLRAQVSSINAYADTATNVNTRLNVANLALQGLSDIGTSVKKRGQHVDHRAQQQRPDLRPDHGAGGVLERGVAAQQPDRRPLSVFRPRHRHAGDGAGRRHARRHGNAGRVEATDQRTPAGRSGRRQHGASDGLVAAVDDHRDQPGRGRFVVRVEARLRSVRR